MATFDSTDQKAQIRSDKPHNLSVGEQVIIRNVDSSNKYWCR